MRLLTHLTFFACFALCMLVAPAAHAGKFDISPVSLTLSGKSASSTLVITNRSPEELRFHVTAYSWRQRPDGEMILEPTKDIVFFPAMMTVKPNGSRQIRVGAKVRATDTERTYRIFVQELPPLARSTEEATNTVRMLTKMGIPVFLEPASPKANPELTTPKVTGREVSFSLHNRGNSRMVVQKCELQALRGGKPILTEQLSGWYILAGGRRDYTATLPEDACKQADSLRITVETDRGGTRTSLPELRCGS
ncbi:MAG: fimbria/pilus periplasmic chaperone [Myxococcales bacterium]|jgi:fimbrial chaperone protein